MVQYEYAMYCMPFKTRHVPTLLNLFLEKCVSVPIYLSLSARTDPREQTIQVAKVALMQEI